ncbi:hypothetical protein [Microbispora sp. GKU 823]|uniref:hypothetical protein n=1 Tax=Microbispora sp. GKU 823 TaxID=1652100 RepID=UPI0009A2F60B|nr:hypothetical protein [Microbispora sp. GKU 823]OPG10931.1 hypothetical protein B1L11_22460 [Microbispora sp. GKU 823]
MGAVLLVRPAPGVRRLLGLLLLVGLLLVGLIRRLLAFIGRLLAGVRRWFTLVGRLLAFIRRLLARVWRLAPAVRGRVTTAGEG